MEERIDRTGLSDAEVLMALYNASHPLGMGFLHYQPGKLTVEQVEDIIKNRGDDHAAMFRKRPSSYYDYLKGRVIKTNISENPLRLQMFDRDNGSGAGRKAIKSALKEKGESVRGTDGL